MFCVFWFIVKKKSHPKICLQKPRNFASHYITLPVTSELTAGKKQPFQYLIVVYNILIEIGYKNE